MMSNNTSDTNNTSDATIPALQHLGEALEEIVERADELDGVSQGTLHALELAAQAFKTDSFAAHAVMRTHQGQAAGQAVARLAEAFNVRSAFLAESGENGDEDGENSDDDLAALSHDLDALAIHAGDLVGQGLLSGHTKSLLDHAAHVLRADLEAANTPETMQASEWDFDDDEDEEHESPDLWPDADRIARRRFGQSLDALKLKDPEKVQALLYEAEANRRRR